jgi:hypothetical protein
MCKKKEEKGLNVQEKGRKRNYERKYRYKLKWAKKGKKWCMGNKYLHT